MFGSGSTKVYPVIAWLSALPQNVWNTSEIGGACIIGFLPVVSHLKVSRQQNSPEHMFSWKKKQMSRVSVIGLNLNVKFTMIVWAKYLNQSLMLQKMGCLYIVLMTLEDGYSLIFRTYQLTWRKCM
jgi:hypothetical protein